MHLEGENQQHTNLYNYCKIDNNACNVSKDKANDAPCNRWWANIYIYLHK